MLSAYAIVARSPRQQNCRMAPFKHHFWKWAALHLAPHCRPQKRLLLPIKSESLKCYANRNIPAIEIGVDDKRLAKPHGVSSEAPGVRKAGSTDRYIKHCQTHSESVRSMQTSGASDHPLELAPRASTVDHIRFRTEVINNYRKTVKLKTRARKKLA